MTALAFTAADWAILGGYVAVLTVTAYLSTRRQMEHADDYFLASHSAPTWLVAVSVLSTIQSAATFLGVPDNSFRGDWSYLGAYLAALIAAFVVGRYLLPRFYAIQADTVYELLEHRFDATARRAAGAMYLVGRILASGARLYLAAIAVSMIVFLDVAPEHIVIASFILLLFGLVFTFMGGLNSVIWSDLVQVVLYVGAAVVVLIYLLTVIPAPLSEIWAGLVNAPDGGNKLLLLDTRFDFSAPFSIFAILTGLVLLNVGNAGLDQDTTQRLLACKNAKEGARSLYLSAWVAIPVVALFLAIGSLLHIFYERPDLMAAGGGAVQTTFQGESITVFMHFILSEMPPGLRGLVTVGVIASAAINSGLISMAAVLVNDFYRPWAERRGQTDERRLIVAGKGAILLLGLMLFGMSIFCYFWQRATDTPLLEFVLGVMVFAYSGLLGVYFTALFTTRGSSGSVIAALIGGFMTVLLLQPYIVAALGLPEAMGQLAFPWQLCIGTLVSVLICCCGNQRGRRERTQVPA